MAEPEGGPAIVSGLRWTWRQITSRLWFRVSLFAAAAVLTALVAVVITPLVPEAMTESIGDDATWNILSILASSMLVVATFSLGTMVQAFAAVASTATPRAARVLIEDPFSQNVLSTFLGAFVFAMVGLVAIGFGYYGPAGRTVLLISAGLVILFVISTFFAWLDHLANMVRLGETQRKIEALSREVLSARVAQPFLGGVAISDADRRGIAVKADETLYVQHVDMKALQKVAEAAGGRVAVACGTGALTDPTRALVWTSWMPGDKERAKLRAAFSLGAERSFDQDPRFCLQVLAEIGSRALSSGINDPGTAIGIIAGQQRLLTLWGEWQRDAEKDEEAPRFPLVAVEPVTPGELFEDAFAPLLRDGARIVEVGIRLQKALLTLGSLGLPGFAEQARLLSRHALAHAEQGLEIEADRERIAALAAKVKTLT